MNRFVPFCLAVAVSFFNVARAQSTALPAKQTFLAPMRDGVKLATDVYLPADQGPFPVILLRTPYNKDSAGALGSDGARRGYAIVIQDTRGRFASQGENLPFEGDGWAAHWDGYDTLEWLVKQPWCNGRIGSSGGSAGAIAQLLMAGAGTTRLACQHIVVGGPSLYRDVVYTGGVFRKALVEDWLRATKFSPEALTMWTSHPFYDDYWRQRDLTAHYGKINSPAVHVGGYFDIFAQGTIDAFVGYQSKGGPGARGRQKLVMGPWTHGVLTDRAGEMKFPNAKRPPGNVHDSWLWFDAQLKGIANGITNEPAVTYYVMGDVGDTNAPGNVWRTAGQWPPVAATMTLLYLRDDHSLSTKKPRHGNPFTYAYDPKDPAPTVGGPQLSLPAGPIDQRKIEARPDMVVFSTEVLAEPLEVTGRVRMKLWASSDAPDTDWTAKLCDVYPDGRSYNICEGILRARFRESFDREKLLEPGKVYPFVIDLWSTSIVFNRGHRLRVLVTSSGAPGYDPNPNTGEPFRGSDHTRVAHNTIYFDAARPSHIELPVVAGTKARR